MRLKSYRSNEWKSYSTNFAVVQFLSELKLSLEHKVKATALMTTTEFQRIVLSIVSLGKIKAIGLDLYHNRECLMLWLFFTYQVS